jgi:ABC-2 type transport system permease protein
LLLGAVCLTIGVSALVAGAHRYAPEGSRLDTVSTGLSGVVVGQLLVAGLAVLVVGAEYGSGMIIPTLTAVPRRVALLGAKAAVVTGIVVVAAVLAILGSVLAGQALLRSHGYTTTHGYPSFSLGDGPTLRAVAGSVLYLCLIALLSLGVATAVRDSATAIGVVLALLFLFPIIASAVNSHWQRHLEQVAPMTTGLYVQDTVNLHSLPLTPWQGLGVLGLWAAGALVLGTLRLRLSDA